LVGAACCMDGACEQLGDTTRDNSSQDIADDQPADSTIRFLEGNHASQTDGSGDGGWDASFGELLADIYEQGGCRFIIQDQSQRVCCETRKVLVPPRSWIAAKLNDWAGNWRGWSGTNCWIAGWLAVYGSAGLRAGSWSCGSVAAVPGAGGVAVNACRAADNSPWCTRCRARCVRHSGLVWCWAVGGAGPVDVSPGAIVPRMCCHSPCWKASRRLRHSSFGKVRVPGGRWRSNRGNRSQSVHARVDSVSVRAARICSKVKCMAARTLPRMNCGGVAKAKSRFGSTPNTSMWSSDWV
jgi:hypothetical protein